uniref:Tudor domain-containing protein n=1 Tax=Macrostomum lignano TaxID=282301 RepID=A0A1I8FFX1_9PLAT
MDPDRPFVPLPLQPSRYASIGLPPTSEPCPVEATDILDLPCCLYSCCAGLRSRSANERLASTYQSDLSAAWRGYSVARCVAKFSEDGVWYRAEVLLFKEDTMLVYFVDYGNAEYMSLARSECNLCQPLFLDEPCLAVRCRLQGLVISCLVATGAAHDDDKQQPPEQKQLWLDVKRRYDDEVRQRMLFSTTMPN